MITKSDAESSDSFLAQGGICVLRDDTDYDSYFEEERYAVVLEGVIMVNSRIYPGNEIHSIADIYGGLLGRRRAC